MYFFFIIFFFIIIKTSKNLSAKYYQENKDRLQKRPSERYQNLSLEGKKKKQEFGREHVNITKISQKMKKNKLVECREKYQKMRKIPFYDYKKLIF